MKKDEFFNQYKDPRWQRKRLKIMQRDKFMCVECGDEESTLNVHHLIYHKDKSPWEYNDDELKTLCESCHESISGNIQSIKQIIGTLNGEVLHYAVDILLKMQHLYPPDCMDLLELATELSDINTGKK